MKQVIVIHGGDSFDTHEDYLQSLKFWPVTLETFLPRENDWKWHLQGDLGAEYQVFLPQMPNKSNARYSEWKIWFERMFPFLNNEVILVGHSMGGTFLAKYLSENTFPKNINLLILTAPAHNQTREVGDFILGNLSSISKQCKLVHIFHSQDDQVVPFSELGGFKKELPQAQTHILEDRGHFPQEHFPEVVQLIKSV